MIDELLYEPAAPGFAERALAVYRVLRDEYPLYHDPSDRFWVLSRFEDVHAATLDWETFSSTGKIEAILAKPTMNSYDPPLHTQMRGLVSRAFSPRRINEIEPDIRAMTRRLLADFVGSGHGDGMADFAALLPAMVIGKLIGLPDELVDECRHLTDQMMRIKSPEEGAQYALASYEIFRPLYEERRRRPQDDLMTALLQAEIDGARLSEDDLLAFGWLMLVGGNDTTTNLIGNGIELLARHPDQRRELAANPQLIANAVDEVLRYASPNHSLPRMTTRDVEHEHGKIPKGARVMLLWAAANVDEREFEDPERFDVHRRAPRHLALGHGIHYCLGAHLAKMEARIAWQELLACAPEYELAETPRHFESSTFYGWESLALTFEPASLAPGRP